MRVDHHAYRKATHVAGLGFVLQVAMGLALLIFGVLAGDTVFRFAAFYVLGGGLVWLSLIVIFYQHTQERLEALEQDEIALARGGAGSVFRDAREGEHVAARRLKLMHTWLMPLVSLVVAAYMALGAAWMLRYMSRLEDATHAGRDFHVTSHRGWAIATALAFAAVSFIFSRFVAGMARQTAWQNLRGGAAFMVGNALVMLAAAVALVFQFFDNPQVTRWIAYAIPVFLLLLVVEIAIHFVLNMYRPRVSGEVPRPAFDSRVLSLLAAPESIVRSLNEAVNYQFGFDITSSWGYQLMLRSFGWLLAFGLIVLVGLDTMVVVEPQQQAVKLSGGEIVGGVHAPGVMWKLPWPLQTADVYDVGRIRTLPLTARRLDEPDVQVWADKVRSDRELDQFLVGGGQAAPEAGSPTELYSLVEAQISLDYRIKDGGLRDYLGFSSDLRRRAGDPTMREQALKALALRVITQHLSGLSIEDVLTTGRAQLLGALRDRIQAAFDGMSTGVEVAAVSVPLLRPAGPVATFYEDYAMALANRRQTVEKERQDVSTSLAQWIGDPDKLPEILAGIEQWRRLREQHGPDAAAVVEKRQEVERILAGTGGILAQIIADAEAQGWVTLMNARGEIFKHQGQLAAYLAAPRLFQTRETMGVLGRMLANRRKYIFVGVDPDRVRLSVALQDSSSQFSFSDSQIKSQGESR